MRIWQIPPRFLDKNILIGESGLLTALFYKDTNFDTQYSKSYLYFRWILVSKEIVKRYGVDEDSRDLQNAIDHISISEVKQSFSIDIIRKEISILIDIWELSNSYDLIEKLSLQSSDDILGENLYLLEIIQKGLIKDV